MTTALPPDQPAAPPPPPAAPSERGGFNLGDFLSFRYMITPPLVQVIYVVVTLIITIVGLVTMVSDAPGGGPLPGLLIIVFGNLVWRVYMEIVMLFFRINDGVQAIERNTRR
jgi:hypothetical protein